MEITTVLVSICQTTKLETSKSKALHMTKAILLKHSKNKFVSGRLENIVAEGESAVTSISSFSNKVFRTFHFRYM